MSSYNASNDLWYQYFTSAGPQWMILLAFDGFRALCGTFGMLLNFSLVYITAKSTSLRGLCNILLALESALSLLYDVEFYFNFLVVLSGKMFIRYEHCFWAVIAPICFCDMAQLTMLFTGTDRLLSVAFPFWYGKRNIKRYLVCILALLCCYVTYDCVIYYNDYLYTMDIMVTCSTEDMGQSEMRTWIRANYLVLSGTSLAVYLLCWLMVFPLKSTGQNVQGDNRRVIKALLFIITLNLVGVFSRNVVTLVLVNSFVKGVWRMVSSLLIIVVYNCNAPMLYIISHHYRAQFDHHFPWLKKLFARKTEQKVAAPSQQSLPRVNNYLVAQRSATKKEQKVITDPQN